MSEGNAGNRWGLLALVAVFYALATFVMMRPLVPFDGMANRLAPWDAKVNAYLLAWGQKALLTKPLSFYDAPVFYPLRHASAQADPFPAWCLISSPLSWISPNVIWDYHASQLLQRFLCAMSAFLLALVALGRKRGTDLQGHAQPAAFGSAMAPLDTALALWVGFVYAFNSRVFWHAAGQPNILSNLFLPLGFLALLRSVDRWRPGTLLLLFVASVLQILSSWYLAVIYLIGCATLWASLVWSSRAVWRTQCRLWLCPPAVLAMAALVCLPAASVHARMANEFGAWRTLAQTVLGSADPLAYIVPPTELLRNATWAGLLWRRFHVPSVRSENNQFLGWAVALLCVLALVRAATKRGRGTRQDGLLPWVLVASAGFILSLGPFLWIGKRLTAIPLPWLWIYEAAPPLRFMRGLSRFSVLVYLASALIAALGVARWSVWRRVKHPRACAWSLGFGLILISAIEQYPASAVPHFPYHRSEAADWIERERPNDPVAFMPFEDKKVEHLLDVTPAFTPLINGWRPGVRDPFHQWKRENLRNFPSEESVAFLQFLGARTIVVEEDPGIRQAARNSPWLKPLAQFPSADVYELAPDPRILQRAKAIPADGWRRPEPAYARDFPSPAQPEDLVFGFNGDGNAEGWFLASPRLARMEVSHGALSGALRSFYAPIIRQFSPPLDPGRIREMQVRARLGGLAVEGQPFRAGIYWETEQARWDEEKSMWVEVWPRGQWQILSFNFDDPDVASRWLSHGRITGLRFDSYDFGYPGLRFDVDEIRLICGPRVPE